MKLFLFLINVWISLSTARYCAWAVFGKGRSVSGTVGTLYSIDLQEQYTFPQFPLQIPATEISQMTIDNNYINIWAVMGSPAMNWTSYTFSSYDGSLTSKEFLGKFQTAPNCHFMPVGFANSYPVRGIVLESFYCPNYFPKAGKYYPVEVAGFKSFPLPPPTTWKVIDGLNAQGGSFLSDVIGGSDGDQLVVAESIDPDGFTTQYALLLDSNGHFPLRCKLPAGIKVLTVSNAWMKGSDLAFGAIVGGIAGSKNSLVHLVCSIGGTAKYSVVVSDVSIPHTSTTGQRVFSYEAEHTHYIGVYNYNTTTTNDINVVQYQYFINMWKTHTGESVFVAAPFTPPRGLYVQGPIRFFNADDCDTTPSNS